MTKLTKNQKAVQGKFDSEKEYSLTEASKLVKEITVAAKGDLYAPLLTQKQELPEFSV